MKAVKRIFAALSAVMMTVSMLAEPLCAAVTSAPEPENFAGGGYTESITTEATEVTEVTSSVPETDPAEPSTSASETISDVTDTDVPETDVTEPSAPSESDDTGVALPSDGIEPEDSDILGDSYVPDVDITYCGMPEHIHSEACYNPLGELICGVEEHVHTDACLSASMMGIFSPYTLVNDDPDTGFVLSLNAGGGYTLTFTGTKVPESIWNSELLKIGGIDYRSSITNVIINDSVEVIGEGTFNGFTSLFSVEFAGVNTGITAIPNYAFANTPRLREVNIQDLEKLDTIGESAFVNSGIQSITIPDTLKTFEENKGENEEENEPKPFSGCTSLVNVFFEENNVLDKLPSFSGLTSLETINLENLTNPNGVSLTSAYTFSGCTSLKEITIPGSIKHRYDLNGSWYSAFQNCTSLESITFLDNYNEFSYDFGEMNSQITELDLSPLHNFKEIHISLDDVSKSLKKLTLPAEVESLYLSADGSMSVEVNIPADNSVTKLEGYVFPSAESLDLSIFPNLTTLGAYAFSGNTSLKELTIPENITTIDSDGTGVFKNLISLERLNIASNLSTDERHYLSDSAFEGTSGFELHFEDSITKIEDSFLASAYGHYSSITFDPNMSFYVIADGPAIKGGPFAELEKGRYDYATDGQGNLYLINKDGTATLILVNHDSETVNIPASVGDYSVTGIASDAFKDCKATSAVFAAPDAITSIAERAFADASQLASVNGKTTVKEAKETFTAASVPSNAFKNTLLTEDSGDGENYLDGASAIQDTVRANGVELAKSDTLGQLQPDENAYCKKHDKVVEGEKSYWYLTGQSAEIKAALSNLNSGEKYRVYALADDPDTFNPGEYFVRIPGTSVFYRDFLASNLNAGETTNVTLSMSYPAYPTEPGTKACVWCARMPENTDENTIYRPNQTYGDGVDVSKDYIMLRWDTKRVEYNVTKKNIEKSEGGTAAVVKTTSDVKSAIAGLGYDIDVEVDGEGYDYVYGADYVKSVEFSDTLALGDNLYWRALDTDNCRLAYNGDRSEVQIYAKSPDDSKEYLVATLSGFGSGKRIASARLSKEGDKITVHWTVENTTLDGEGAAELTISTNEKIEFGPEVILADTSSSASEYSIENDIHAKFNYTHSEFSEKDAHHEAVKVTASSGMATLTKQWVNKPSYLNEEGSFEFVITNETSQDVTLDKQIYDFMNSYLCMTPEQIEGLFADENLAKILEVRVGHNSEGTKNCAGFLKGNVSAGSVTAVDGSTSNQKSYYNSTVNDLSDYNVMEFAPFVDGTDYDAGFLVIVWEEHEGHPALKVERHMGQFGNLEATYYVGENGTYSKLADLFRELKLVYLPETQCRIFWKFQESDGSFVLKPGETMKIPIDVYTKDTFMLTQDTGKDGTTPGTYGDQQYAAGWSGENIELNPFVREWWPENFYQAGLDGSETSWHGYSTSGGTRVVRDLSIVKKAIFTEDGEKIEIGTQEGNNDDITDRLRLDMEMEYALYLRHYGSGTYDLLPVVDHMDGLQTLLAKASENVGADWIGQTQKYYDENGELYYAFTTPGTYYGVYLGDYYADSVEVTEQRDSENKHRVGLDTIIRFYFANTSPVDFTQKITYKITTNRKLILGADADALTQWTLNNGVWVNDVPGRRIRDNLLHDGTLLKFDKHIVTKKGVSPARDGLTRLSAISQDSNVVTYRLKLYNNSRTETVELFGEQIRDILPNTFGVFEWDKSTDGVADTTGEIALSYYDKGSLPKVEYDGKVGNFENGQMIFDDVSEALWSITEGDTQNIEWNEKLKLTFEPEQALYIYVTVVYPNDSSAEGTGKWDEYFKKAKPEGEEPNKIVNAFEVYGLEKTVEHTLVGTGRAFIQKGVYDTGYYVTKNRTDDFGWALPHYYGADRLHYSYGVESTVSNSDIDGIINTVTYYVIIANTGTEDMYFNTVYDVLPNGFKFYSMRCGDRDAAYMHHVGGWQTNQIPVTSHGAFDASGARIADVELADLKKLGVQVTNKDGSHELVDITRLEDSFVSFKVSYDDSLASDGIMCFNITGTTEGGEKHGIYDAEKGACLKPGEYTQFAYEVTTGSEADLASVNGVAENTAYLEYWVPGLDETVAPAVNLDTDTGVNVCKVNGLAPNDGDRKVLTNDDIASAFTEKAHSKNPRWLASTVTVTPGEIVPGIVKKTDKTLDKDMKPGDSKGLIDATKPDKGVNWTVDIQNNGSSAMVYDFEDTIELPFNFIGKVTFDLYAGGNGKAYNASENPILSAKDDGLFEILSCDESGIKIKYKYNGRYDETTINAGYSGQIPMYFYSPLDTTTPILTTDVTVYYKCEKGKDKSNATAVPGDYGTATLKIAFSEAKNSELLGIPAGGKASFTLSSQIPYNSDNGRFEYEFGTYRNRAYAYPENEFNANRVNIGSVVTDTDGEGVGVSSLALVNVHNGFPTESYNEVCKKAGEGEDDADVDYGTTYPGSKSDRIHLDDTSDEFEYRLYVHNMSDAKGMNDLVIIDILPHLEDADVLASANKRGSKFLVNFAEDPNVRVYIAKKENLETITMGDGRIKLSDDMLLDTSSYTVGYSKTDSADMLTTGDWDGRSVWNNSSAGMSAVRIHINDKNKIKAGDIVIVVFDAVVNTDSESDKDDTADPGEIAWNSFGYRYTYSVGGEESSELHASAAPLNVGVSIPSVPTIQKKVVNAKGEPFNTNGVGRTALNSVKFIIYEGDAVTLTSYDEYSITGALSGKTHAEITVNLNGSQSDVISLDKDNFNTLNSWTWIDGQKYTIVEVDSNTASPYAFRSFETNGTLRQYTFTYNQETTLNIVAYNVIEPYKIEITKTDSKNSEVVLSDAEFGLYSRSGSGTALEGNSDYHLVGEAKKTDDSGVVTFDDLYDDEYIVVELRAPEGYELDDTQYKFSRSEAGLDYTIEQDISNKKLPELGNLSVTKKLESVSVGSEFKIVITLNVPSGTDGFTANYEYSSVMSRAFSLPIINSRLAASSEIPIVTGATASDDGAITYVSGDTIIVTVMLSNNETFRLTGLPKGITYEVKEVFDAPSADKDKYDVSYTNENGSIIDGDRNVTVTNTEIGRVSFTKEMADGVVFPDGGFEFVVAFKDSTGKPISDKFEYTFGDKTDEIKSWDTLTLTRDNYTVTFPKLPAGTKVFFGERRGEDDVYYCLNSDNGTLGIETFKGTNYQGVTLDADSGAEVSATYTNSLGAGKLTVEKKMVSSGYESAVFTFRIVLTDSTGTPISGTFDTDTDGTDGTVSFNKTGVGTVKLSPGETVTIKNLPEGAKYTVTETGGKLDGTDIDPKTYGAAIEGGEGTITADSSVKFTNFEAVELRLNKKVVGGGEGPFNVTVKITEIPEDIAGSVEIKSEVYNKGGVRQDNSSVPVVNGGCTVKANLSPDGYLLITGIPKGAKATVSEDNGNYIKILAVGGGAVQLDDTAYLLDSPKNVFDLFNITTGELQLTKTVSNIDSAFAGTFSFDITFTAPSSAVSTGNAEVDEIIKNILDNILENAVVSGAVSNEVKDDKLTVTVRAGETVTVSNLPIGTDYTVTETVSDDYNLTTPNGLTGTISVTPSEAKFTNAIKLGSLEISKTVSGNAPTGDSFSFTVKLTLNGKPLTGEHDYTIGDEPFTANFNTDGKAKISLQAGETAVFATLPYGTEYTVTENVSDDYNLKTETGSTGKIGETASKAEFTNEHKPGTLKITKTVSGNAPAGDQFSFTVKLTLNGKPLTGEYDYTIGEDSELQSVIFDDKGEATVSLQAGQTAVFATLPYGTEYTVTENVPDNYVLDASTGTTDTIGKDESNAAFTNRVLTPGYEIKKTVEGADGDTVYVKPGEKVTYVITVTGLGDTGSVSKNINFSDKLPDWLENVTIETDGVDDPVKTAEKGYITYKWHIDRLENGKTVTVRITAQVNKEISESKVWSNVVINPDKPDEPYDTSETVESDPGNLSIEKIVKDVLGKIRDADKTEFDFTIKLTLPADSDPADSDKKLSKSYPYMLGAETGELRGTVTTDENGQVGIYSVKLANGDKLVISNLPTGATYTVTEALPEGTTYTNGTVTKKGTVSKSTPVVQFTNIYHPAPASGEISFKKKLTGELVNEDFKFSFTAKLQSVDGTAVEQVEGASDAVTVVNPTAEVELHSEAGKKEVTADSGKFDITFKAAGKYVFLISEDESGYPAVHPGGEEYTAEFTVTEDSNGGLIVSGPVIARVGGEGTEAVFTNTFDPSVYSLSAKKTLSGNIRDGASYNFTILVKKTKDAGVEITNAEDVEIHLTELNKSNLSTSVTVINEKYERAGEYVYEITEKPENGDPFHGITFDESKYTVTVTVAEVGGQLTVSSAKIEKDGKPADTVEFANSYAPDSATAAVTLKKSIDKRGWTDDDDWAYTFELKPAEPDGKDTLGKTGILPDNKTVITATAKSDGDGAGRATFGEITFTEAGNYYYTLSEAAIPESVHGITKDDSVVSVIIIVTDIDGKLTAEVKYDNADSVEFVNKFTPGTATIGGTKRFSGRLWTSKDSDVFEFTLKPVGNAPMPQGSDGSCTKKAQTDGDGTYGSFTFPSITYTEPGTYEYTVSETGGSADRVTNDGSTVSVKVVIDEDFKPSVTYSYNGGAYSQTRPVFTNLYTPEPVTRHFEAEKKISGRDWSDAVDSGRYEFTLTPAPENSDSPMPDGTEGGKFTVTAGSGGKIVFPDIRFDKVGTYVYQIAEEAYNKNGITSSTEIHTATVVISDTNGDGVLESSVKYDTSGTPTFTNTYTRSTADATVSVNKKLLKDGAEQPLTDYTFSFTMTAGDNPDGGMTLPENKTATVSADTAKAKFGKITFTKAGKYSVTVTEDDNGKDVGYDERTLTVRFEVAENISDGTLTVKPAVYEFDDGSNDPTFVNTLEPSLPDITIEKNQSVNGGDATKNKLEVKPGDEVTYYLKVTSIGEDGSVAKNVTVSDEIPEGLTLVPGSISDGGTESGGIITWNLSDIPKGTSKTVSFKVTVPEIVGGASWTNIAYAGFDRPDNPDEPDIPSNKAEIEEPVPDITIEKTQSVNGGDAIKNKLVVAAGDRVTYYITVTSIGKIAAKDVVITDRIPSGLSLVDGTISDRGSLGKDGVTITWNVGDLEVGESATVHFTVTVPPVSEHTEWINGASTHYSNNPDNPDNPDNPEKEIPSNKVEIEEPVPDITIEKTQSVNGGDAIKNKLVVAAGDRVTYYITVTSIGKIAAKDVVITDRIPSGLSLVDGTISDRGSLGKDGVTITWNVGDLEVGESATVHFTVTVPPVSEHTEWINGASTHYSNNQDNPDEPDKPDIPSNEVEIEEKCGSLTVRKTVGGNAGDTVSAFGFRVVLTDENGNPLGESYPYSGSRRGTVRSGETLMLAHGESVTVEGLPTGTRYEITETDSRGHTVRSSGSTGEISSEAASFADFVNIRNITYPEIPTGSLTVGKTVGEGGDASREFAFTVKFFDPSGREILGRFAYSGSKSGSISSGGTILLKHGESVTITGLPAGTVYSVTEAPNDGYISVSTGENGTVIHGGEEMASFVNLPAIAPPSEAGHADEELYTAPDNPARSHAAAIAALALTAALAAASAALIKKRR